MSIGLVLVLGAIGGVVTGVMGLIDERAAAALAVAVASIAVVADRRRRVPMLVTAVIAVAALYGAVTRRHALNPPFERWLHARAAAGRVSGPVTITGVLRDDAAAVDAGVQMVVEIQSVADGRTSDPLTGRAHVTVIGELARSRFVEWTSGRTIVAPMHLREPDVLRNPGGPSEAWQRLRRRVDLVGTTKSAALIEVGRGPPWAEAFARLRRHVRDAISRHVAPWSTRSAAVVTAILIGDRIGLDDEVERRLQAAGTYHTIAISGGNVAMIAALALVVCRGLVRSARARSAIAIVVVSSYGAVVVGQPSVSRAVTAACLYLLLGLAGLVPVAIRVVALVALVLIAVDPLAVVDAGAWLSFGATAAIVLAAPRALAWFDAVLVQPRGSLRSVAGRVGRVFAASFAATLAAEVALWPVSAAVFERLTVAGLALNVIAIPAMAATQFAGLLSVGFAGWWEAGAALMGHGAHLASTVLVESAFVVELAPWTSWRVPAPALGWVIVYYATVATAFASRRALIRRAALAVAVTAAVVIGAAPALEWRQPGPARLRVTMIDVGQGDACLVQFPGGRALLVDAGGRAGTFDIGGRVVVPAAWHSGVRRLDWFAVTHPDLDHAGGAASVIRDLMPREVWEGVPVLANPLWLTARRLALGDDDRRSQRGGVWRQLAEGHRIEIGRATLDVVHPARPDWERPRSRNDDSLVIRVTFGGVEIWLTGDAGQEFEARVTPEPVPSGLRVLKVAHHGSRSSTSQAFVRALKPDLALISAGRHNTFGHPAPDVVRRLLEAGARVVRTDRDGAITIETDGSSIDVVSVGGARWSMAPWPPRGS